MYLKFPPEGSIETHSKGRLTLKYLFTGNNSSFIIPRICYTLLIKIYTGQDLNSQNQSQ